MNSDGRHIARAVRLGERALGATAENPPVGCVIANGAHVLGVGWTQTGGRPHAETVALAMAGAAARGATAYVTLEPCAHHGRTGPCAEALIEAGIARVVIAAVDPDPRVNGCGMAMLEQAGVEVGLGAGAAADALNGFLIRTTSNRPQVLLKLAISADGMMASAPGQRTAITGLQAQARVHLMRAQTDAILIGHRTLISDDPALTCRLPGLEYRSPLRFVAIREGTIPARARIQPAEILSTGDGLEAALASLAQRGINRVLLEGGAVLASAFLEAGLVDEVTLIRAPHDLGAEGVPAPLDLIHQHFIICGVEPLGQDRLTRYERRG